ncbi:DgyrCDS9792 [Dimorphilus gyrociliatus]|uniref:DgyrCDS9792 n=1 Tax=Dimorphilus gyrociliatus TaxID=2664684 RepID=A0A7I8W080_9ANNE|nr:DgyrCDS9792 [Dimorphilus gyrociliatus]
MANGDDNTDLPIILQELNSFESRLTENDTRTLRLQDGNSWWTRENDMLDSLKEKLENKPDVFKERYLRYKENKKYGVDEKGKAFEVNTKQSNLFEYDTVLVNCQKALVEGLLVKFTDYRYTYYICKPDGKYLIPFFDKKIPTLYRVHRYTVKSRNDTSISDGVLVFKFDPIKEGKITALSEIIDRRDREKYYYICIYLKWNSEFNCPLCLTVGKIQKEYLFYPEVLQQILKITQPVFEIKSKLPQLSKTKQYAFDRSIKSYIITESQSTDNEIECMFSVQSLRKNEYLIGIHIVDASFYIESDHFKESLYKGRSFNFGENATLPLFDKSEMERHPSFNSYVHTISIFFQYNSKTTKIKHKEEKSLKIRQPIVITYEKVQQVIDNEIEDYPDLRALYEFSKVSRKQRLDHQNYSEDIAFKKWDIYDALLMVQELHIQANVALTQLLLQNDKDYVPYGHVEEWWTIKSNGKNVTYDKDNESHVPTDDNIVFIKELWNIIRINLAQKKYETIRKILLQIDHRPLEKLSFIERSPHFAKFKVDDESYSLDSTIMTFTSPMTRIIDVFNQYRLFYEDPEDISASEEDFLRILMSFNDKNSIINALHEEFVEKHHGNGFTKRKKATCISLDKKRNLILLSVVQPKTYELNDIELNIVNFGTFNKSMTSDSLKLEWKERIFHVNEQQYESDESEFNFNLKDQVLKISTKQWKIILETIENPNGKEALISDLINEIYPDENEEEVRVCSKDIDTVAFSLLVEKGNVIDVIIGSSTTKPTIRPQYLFIKHNLGFCMDHIEDPFHCFCESINYENEKDTTYESKEEFLKIWSPVLNFQSVKMAIKYGDRFTLNNVNVRYRDGYCVFQLEQSLFNDKMIEIEKGDYFCISQQVPNTNTALNNDLFENKSSFWICHGVCIENDNIIKIEIISSSNYDFPPDHLNATIKVYRKLNEYKEKDRVLNDLLPNLKKDTLIHKIITNYNTNSKVDLKEISIVSKIKGLKNLKKKQKEAVEFALQRQFSVIKSADTVLNGKLITFIAYGILEDKDKSSERILICCPSAKSGNNVIKNLMKITTKDSKILNYIQVFSDVTEKADCKLRNDLVGFFSSEDKKEPVILKEKALHHIIREGKYSKEILEMEKNPVSFNRKDYKELVKKAKIDVLKEADVVITTCKLCSLDCIQQSGKFTHLIINDAGKCNEMDSLIPLLNYQPENIILIGNRKPPSLIFNTKTFPKSLGQTSLFKRYSKNESDILFSVDVEKKKKRRK